MKYCTKCGNELVDEAVVCPKCGCDVANTNYSQNGTTQRESTNIFAIIGFISSLASLLFILIFPFLVQVLGFVFGGVGLAKSKTMNGKGKGLSIAAIVISGVSVFIQILVLILAVGVVVFAK